MLLTQPALTGKYSTANFTRPLAEGTDASILDFAKSVTGLILQLAIPHGDVVPPDMYSFSGRQTCRLYLLWLLYTDQFVNLDVVQACNEVLRAGYLLKSQDVKAL